MRNIFSLAALLCALALLATACGGGGDDLVENLIDQTESSSTSSDSSSNDNNASGDSSPDTTTSDSGSSEPAAAPVGPLTGPLWTTGSFGLGLFTVSDTGQVQELATDLVDQLFDRNNPPVVTDEAAYVLGATQREGTDFSFDVSVLRVDRALSLIHI